MLVSKKLVCLDKGYIRFKNNLNCISTTTMFKPELKKMLMHLYGTEVNKIQMSILYRGRKHSPKHFRMRIVRKGNIWY